MSANVRRNLAVQLVAGGENPLRLQLVVNPSVLPMKIGQTIAAGFLALVAQGGAAPYAYSIVSGSLPAGLSLDSTTGYITGTVDAAIDTSGTTNAGFHSFVAQCEDSDTTIFEDGFQITIEHDLQPIAATPTPGEPDLAYSYTFKVSGSTGTVSWSTSGTLPTGLSIDSSTGVLSGTVDAFVDPGDYTFGVTVSDSGTGDSISFPVTLTVFPEPVATFDNLAPGPGGSASTYMPTLYIGIPYRETTTVAGGLGPVHFTDNFGTVAALGLTLNQATGEITGVLYDFPAGYDQAFPPLIEINGTDALGGQISEAQGVLVILAPNQRQTVQQDGTPVGDPNILAYNFTGSGVSSVSVTDGTATVDIAGPGGGSSIDLLSPSLFGM